MVNVIISTCNLNPHHLVSMIDLANELLKNKENIVVWVNCDESIGVCLQNPLGKSSVCKYCRSMFTLAKTKLICKQRFSFISVSDFSLSSNYSEFKISKLSDLTKISYKGASIGLAVYSTYLTITRNLYPKITDETHVFFSIFLKSSCRMTDLMISINDKLKPDSVYLFNGRLNNSRPIVDICDKNSIKYTCVELVPKLNLTSFNRILFENSMPHSIRKNEELMREIWDKNKNDLKHNSDAHDFFLKRRNAIPAGDVVYTAHQIKDLLPSNWNREIENIVIFNSSEDEFLAIGGEWISDKIFSSQLQGIKEIVEKYSYDNTKHFYLKIHPNLSKVNYRYHLDLYDLNYRNLTVISADSKVSTYKMIDESDKVIVFGSSTGIEAAYSKKPVIQLSKSLYNFTDSVHIPKSKLELWGMIEDINLTHKYNDQVLMYGFFCNSDQVGDPMKIDPQLETFKLFGKKFITSKGLTILSSYKLYVLITILFKLCYKLRYKNNLFNYIPRDEA